MSDQTPHDVAPDPTEALTAGPGPVIDPADRSWTEQAACRALTKRSIPDFLADHDEKGPQTAQVRKAQRVCGPCPVRARCGLYAIENGLTLGVFGGETPKARARPEVRQAWLDEVAAEDAARAAEKENGS